MSNMTSYQNGPAADHEYAAVNLGDYDDDVVLVENASVPSRKRKLFIGAWTISIMFG